MNDIVKTAQRIADDLLFPAALETDRAGEIPVKLLDAIAEAGLYGTAGPASAGGLDADFKTMCDAVEALSSGCLTTAFLWVQHHGVVRAAAASENPAIAGWVEPLCRGTHRAGLALGGAMPGPAKMTARETGDGWLFDGTAPFVSGWGRIDVIHMAARTDDDRLVWALVDAAVGEALSVERLRLVALDSTATVRADLRSQVVPRERVTSVTPYVEGPTPPEVLRIHASLALGVTRRCCSLLGPSPLDGELEALRKELDQLDHSTIERARGAAGELAMRSAMTLSVSRGSRSLLMGDHAQRLLREAFFTLVYALRPGSRDSLLAALVPTGR
jgi:alkylation response protein AidB-like acyl-CoA dehydrogenase